MDPYLSYLEAQDRISKFGKIVVIVAYPDHAKKAFELLCIFLSRSVCVCVCKVRACIFSL